MLIAVLVADVYATSTMKLVVVPSVEVESLYAVSERIDETVFVPLMLDDTVDTDPLDVDPDADWEVVDLVDETAL